MILDSGREVSWFYDDFSHFAISFSRSNLGSSGSETTEKNDHQKWCDGRNVANLWYHPASSSMHPWPQQSGAPGYGWRVRFGVFRIQLGAFDGGTNRKEYLKRELYTE